MSREALMALAQTDESLSTKELWAKVQRAESEWGEALLAGLNDMVCDNAEFWLLELYNRATLVSNWKTALIERLLKEES